MSRNAEEIDLLPGGKWLSRLLLALALGGLAINLLLLFRRLLGDGVVGCGGGSACAELLNSRWSQVFGIPVTVFGVLIYLGLVVSLIARNRPLLSPMLGVLIGVAAWFGWVQAVLLGRYCPWCMAAHAIGLCVAVLGLWRQVLADHTGAVGMKAGVFATCAMLGLGLMQSYGPGAAAYRLDDFKSLAATQTSGIYSRGDGRKAVFADGRRSYNVEAMPHLGRADAKCVLVEYLDYNCPSCQSMGGFLNALMAKHPADICVVILPVPLERSCNFLLSEEDEVFSGSCKLSKLALAVWRTHPEAFAKFHQTLLEGSTPEAATAMAREFLSPSEMVTALKDSWIEELISSNVHDCVAISTRSKKLPKLLITGARMLHGLPSGEAEFIRVMERELGL